MAVRIKKITAPQTWDNATLVGCVAAPNQGSTYGMALYRYPNGDCVATTIYNSRVHSAMWVMKPKDMMQFAQLIHKMYDELVMNGIPTVAVPVQAPAPVLAFTATPPTTNDDLVIVDDEEVDFDDDDEE